MNENEPMNEPQGEKPVNLEDAIQMMKKEVQNRGYRLVQDDSFAYTEGTRTWKFTVEVRSKRKDNTQHTYLVSIGKKTGLVELFYEIFPSKK